MTPPNHAEAPAFSRRLQARTPDMKPILIAILCLLLLLIFASPVLS